MNHELATSRFIVRDDRRETTVVFSLPEAWWSRPYEYAWAAAFIEPGDIALDVASGVCHPFKFLLGERAKAAYACDLDERILSRDAILADIKESIGASALLSFDRNRFDTVRMAHCDMAAMPYTDESFDKLFCISVFEHLPPDRQTATLREFARVLKRSGRLVMTFDHPTVDINNLWAAFAEAGFQFAGPADFTPRIDAISSSMWGPELRCIRLLLERAR